MSSDLRKHPVGYFVWPIIEHLDRDKFEIYCYSFFPYSPDQMQMKFMGRVDKFQNMLEQNAYQVAEIIAEDSVDILFELGGRLGSIRLKLAYIGLPQFKLAGLDIHILWVLKNR